MEWSEEKVEESFHDKKLQPFQRLRCREQSFVSTNGDDRSRVKKKKKLPFFSEGDKVCPTARYAPYIFFFFFRDRGDWREQPAVKRVAN